MAPLVPYVNRKSIEISKQVVGIDIQWDLHFWHQRCRILIRKSIEISRHVVELISNGFCNSGTSGAIC
jgi:hypothetical protein